MDSAAVRQTDTVQAVRETAAAQLEMHVDQKKTQRLVRWVF